MNLVQLAAELDVTRQIIYGWLEAGMPGAKHGYHWEFDLARCRSWLAARELRAGERPDPSLGGTLAGVKIRKALALAQIAEVQSGLIRGELIPREALPRAVAELCYAVRQRLRAIPARISRDLLEQTDRSEIERIFGEAIDEALGVLPS
jgi:phage terminase Nu1 subunit (DNA packaging protein)